MTVRVRFAPSPTGPLHIGGVRTALFNWLFARHHNGAFVLRIEDTDRSRYVEGSIDLITEGLSWLGLDWDEGPDKGGPYGPYIQSERLDIYHQWTDWLVEHGKAYRCYCTPERLERVREANKKAGRRVGYDRRCRNLSEEERQKLHEETNGEFVVRFAMPLGGQTVVNDLIRGNITFNNEELTDLVLMKSDGFPTYHLANVVDDHLMEISHILRAEEWIASAPVHAQLYEAFGWEMPQIAHLPVILNPNGKGKLSKRSARFTSEGMSIPILLHEFPEEGYVPTAILNFLANTGWHIGEDQEVFYMDEAIEKFDISNVNPAGTAFDINKLQWLNGVHIRQMDPVELAKLLKPVIEAHGYEVNAGALLAITPHIQERLKLLPDVIEFTEFLWKAEFEPVAPEELIQNKMDAGGQQKALQAAYDKLQTLDKFDADTIEAELRTLVDEIDVKAGQLFGSLRMAVIAQIVSPPLWPSLEIVGKETVLERLKLAIESLDALIPEAE
ncbi:MAG: glutamate--tRNA ligase [Chloroflexi bacterium]|nr:glutamate--tRNA ligase [Chloroflexota bacterium]